MTLRISQHFELPREAVTETFAILGKRGSGKTNTAVVMVEELVDAGLPVCVVDPVGVWWGLRSGAEGGPGLPITIIGGEHGDVPLAEGSGAAIAHFIVEESAQVVLDLSLLRKAAQNRFMTAFAETLYQLKATRRDPLHLVIDEADAFAPQSSGRGGDVPPMLGAMEDLIRRGRSRGIGMTLITQRPAVLNKNVLTQAEVLVVLKLTAPQDHKAIDEWVKANADEEKRAQVASSLASLPIGCAWFWSPGWLNVFEKVSVRPRRTFDSSATPKPGQRLVAPRELASVDLDSLKARIAATIEQIAAEDPKALRARIKELEAEAKTRTTERIEVPVIYGPLAQAAEAAMDAIDGALEGLAAVRKALRDADLNAALEGLKVRPARAAGLLHGPDGPTARVATPIVAQTATGEPVYGGPPRPMPAVSVPDPLNKALPALTAPVRTQAAFESRLRETSKGASGLAGGERKILTALAQHLPKPLSVIQIALLTGYAHNGGGFRNYLGALRAAGRIEGGSDRVAITQEGLGALGAYAPLPKGMALLEYWLKNAGGRAERLILSELASIYPRALPLVALANRTGYEANGGGFRNACSRLRTLQLAQGRRELRLAETLGKEVA